VKAPDFATSQDEAMSGVRITRSAFRASLTAIEARHYEVGCMRWAAAHPAGQLILALAQVDDMPEQTIRRPLDVANLYDHLRAHPMYSR
jgi:hypothetical protein